jgi:hypothetical protein
MEIETQEDRPEAAAPSGVRKIVLIIGLAFVAGIAAMGWGLTHWDAGRAWLFGATPVAVVPAISYAPQATAPLPSAAPSDNASLAVAAIEARLAKLEAVNGAAVSAPRSEAMLTAFAARRAIDRGIGLGALEPLLNQHFGAVQPRAVATVIEAARQPVSIDQLLTGLAAVGPSLQAQPGEQGWWAILTSGLSSLVTVRQADTPSVDPQLLVEEAAQMVSRGRVDQALLLIARTPNRAAAAEWTNKARRYVETQRALDLLETAALSGGEPTPDRLGI